MCACVFVCEVSERESEGVSEWVSVGVGVCVCVCVYLNTSVSEWMSVPVFKCVVCEWE